MSWSDLNANANVHPSLPLVGDWKNKNDELEKIRNRNMNEKYEIILE